MKTKQEAIFALANYVVHVLIFEVSNNVLVGIDNEKYTGLCTDINALRALPSIQDFAAGYNTNRYIQRVVNHIFNSAHISYNYYHIYAYAANAAYYVKHDRLTAIHTIDCISLIYNHTRQIASVEVAIEQYKRQLSDLIKIATT